MKNLLLKLSIRAPPDPEAVLFRPSDQEFGRGTGLVPSPSEHNGPQLLNRYRRRAFQHHQMRLLRDAKGRPKQITCIPPTNSTGDLCELDDLHPPRLTFLRGFWQCQKPPVTLPQILVD